MPPTLGVPIAMGRDHPVELLDVERLGASLGDWLSRYEEIDEVCVRTILYHRYVHEFLYRTRLVEPVAEI
jgi:hypothetical protein